MADGPDFAAFRKRVADLQREAGLSIAELARCAGLKAPVVSRVLSGVRDPTMGHLTALAKALGVSASSLMKGVADAAK